MHLGRTAGCAKICLGIVALATQTGWADTGTPDKSAYHLFNPTPRDRMRELITDRPDKTESPYTVDAGHFQVETDLAILTYDKATDGGTQTRSRAYSLMVSNLKVGLTNASDLQVVLTPFQSVATETTGSPTDRKSGFGDTVIRLKYNLLGNDGGDIALGIMPFLKLPTHSGTIGNKNVEGGVIVPLALSLPKEFGLGMMGQINRNKNDTDDLYHLEWVSSVTLGHDLVGNLAGYAEFFSLSSNETGAAWVATADFGFTYALNSCIQLDAGLNLGLTAAADDYNPFIGFSARY